VKNNKYSIRRISVGIASIIIGLNVGGVDSVKDEMSTDNEIIIDKKLARLNEAKNTLRQLYD